MTPPTATTRPAPTSLNLGGPTDIRFDGGGNLYIVERARNFVTIVNSNVSTIDAAIGDQGGQGFSGDGGPATSAELFIEAPARGGIAAQPNGDVLLSDGGNNRVRKVTGLGTAGSLGVGRGPCGPAACVLTPDFDWSKSSNTPKAGDTVTFTDKSLGSPTGWSWEFGDGATSNAQNPTHAYAAAGAYNVKLTITKSGSPTASTTKPVAVFPPCPSGTPIGSISGVTKYVGITPQRLLDTRCNAKVGPGGIVTVDIAGQLGVSPSAVGAVALNLTAVQPTAGTYLTVWPSGETQPYTSNLNVTAGQILPNMVIVKTGSDGKINIFNFAGQVDVIADVMGLFPTSTINPLTPFRLLDTRGNNGTPVGVPIGRVGQGGTVDIDVRGQGGVPASGAGSVVLNVTAVGASQAGGFLTVYPGEAAKPDASNLNFTQGETIANLVVVKLGAGASAGHVKFANAIGSIDLVVDVMGWFPDGASAVLPGRGAEATDGHPLRHRRRPPRRPARRDHHAHRGRRQHGRAPRSRDGRSRAEHDRGGHHRHQLRDRVAGRRGEAVRLQPEPHRR